MTVVKCRYVWLPAGGGRGRAESEKLVGGRGAGHAPVVKPGLLGRGTGRRQRSFYKAGES